MGTLFTDKTQTFDKVYTEDEYESFLIQEEYIL